MIVDEIPESTLTRNPKIQLEVILDDFSCTELLLRLDEDDKPRKCSKKGVKIITMNLPYAILEMSERKALEYNLI